MKIMWHDNTYAHPGVKLRKPCRVDRLEYCEGLRVMCTSSCNGWTDTTPGYVYCTITDIPKGTDLVALQDTFLALAEARLS